MKIHNLFFVASITIATAVFVMSCNSSHAHGNADEKNEANEHENLIVVHSTQETAMGIKVTEVREMKFHKVLKVGGEILPTQTSQTVVSAKSNGIVQYDKKITAGASVVKGAIICSISSSGVEGGDPKEQARIKYEIAQKEYDRVNALYRTRLATEKELIEAKQTLMLAQNALEDNKESAVLNSPISGIISQIISPNGSFVTTGMPIAVVCEDSRLVLKATVPQSDYVSFPLYKTANFRLPYSDTIFELAEMDGHRLSSNQMSPITNGYFSLEFEFRNNGVVVPGSYAEVFLIGPEREGVVTVPNSAIIEEQGTNAVFVKHSSEHYEKRVISVGDSDGKNIEIRSGLKAGEMVVTEGAIYVKMAANSGVIPESHHHH